jgi:hypothetical protein
MVNFNNITSITSFKDLKQNKISENKDYIILFFYWESCGACHMAIPVVCEVIDKYMRDEYNCKFIKIHTADIKDTKENNEIKEDRLRKIYKGGVPAFRILKKSGDGYDVYTINNNNYKYSTDGFADKNYSNNDDKYLSTKNTLIDWIDNFNKTPRENYNTNDTKFDIKYAHEIIQNINSPQLERMKSKRYYEKDKDDGSGYTVMQLCDPYVKELNKSFNKIINDKLNPLFKRKH